MKKIFSITLIALSFSLLGQTKIESSIREYFNGSSWEKFLGTDYSYDNNGNLLSEMDYIWSNSNWSPLQQKSYTYNANGKVTEALIKDWDGNSQYINNEKTEYEYNSAGLLTLSTDKEWIGSQWENINQYVFNYNNTKIIQVDVFNYDGGNWVNENRTILNYSGNNLSDIYFETFDGTSWESDERVLFTYNSNNQMINKVFEEFDGSIWIQGQESNNDYDGSFNRIRETISENGEDILKIEYEFDLSFQLSNFSHPFKDKTGSDYTYDDFSYVNKILSSSFYFFNDQTGTYNVTDRTTYNYNSPLVLGVDKNYEMQILTLYPNPSSDFIQISGITKPEKVAVYSLSGIKIFEALVNENEKLNIQQLSKGMYLLKFENENTLKFLKN